MPIRLKDIAQELGVSTVTVSKVLRGNPDIGAKTRARVLERLNALNYRPNMAARGLATGKTFTVGLIVPDLLQPFFAHFAKELGGVLRQHDRALLLASSEEDPKIEAQETLALIQRGVDVLVLASCRDELLPVPELSALPVPLVLFDRRFKRMKANFVGSDDVGAGELATRHLIELNRKRIAHIGGLQTSPARDRAAGYLRALERTGREIDERYLVLRKRLEERGDDIGFSCMQGLLALRRPPDAVFCYNDMTAIGAIQATLQAGLKIPREMAIIGCGNFRYADYLQVPLSSIDQDTAELGRAAAQLTLSIADSPQARVQSIVLKPRLVIRQSSAPPSLKISR